VGLRLEADIQGSGERGSTTFNDPLSGTICVSVLSGCPLASTLSAAAVTSYEAKIEWFGTVRGRLGFLINNQVLVYATGGLAYGKVGVSGNSIVNGSVIGPSFTAPLTQPVLPRSMSPELTLAGQSELVSKADSLIGYQQVGRGNWNTSTLI